MSALQQTALHRHRIVGRGLCMYRCEEFGHVPRAKRRPALELKLQVWSPFDATGFHCVWAGSTAMLWFWDAETVHGQTGERPADRKNTERVLPETVFFPRKADGVYLQACHEGFELQDWRGDVLRDSFWFAQRPDANQTDWFLARRGIAAADPDVPYVPPSAFDSEPWTGRMSPSAWLETNERAVVAACVLALAMAALWQEGRFRKLRHLTQTAEAAFSRIQDEVAPLVRARNELVRLRTRNHALSDLLANPSQAYLMNEVDRTLPSPSATFHEWRYRRGELSVLIEDEAPDPIAYVRALEAHPLFHHVKAEPGRKADRLKISMEVDA